MKSLLFSLLVMNLACFAENASSSATIPPRDTRGSDRAEFVSSLIKQGDVGAEIGVWQGSFAFYTLLPKEPAALYLIDSWAGSALSDPDLGNPSPVHQRVRDRIYADVCRVFAPYPNVQVLKMKSEDAAALFSDEFFDYIYVDGDHSYEGVTRDLTNYLSKVKVGGLIIGDDYGFGQVSVAVQDFLKAHKNEIVWMGNPCVEKRDGQYVIKRKK